MCSTVLVIDPPVVWLRGSIAQHCIENIILDIASLDKDQNCTMIIHSTVSTECVVLLHLCKVEKLCQNIVNQATSVFITKLR